MYNMRIFHASKVTQFLFVLCCCWSYFTIAKLYCPPLIAPQGTNLTCELPHDKENISCSSSWLPSGTIAYFECYYYENQTKHLGQIKCKGRYSEGFMAMSFKSNTDEMPAPMPCEISERRSSPEFHHFGYGKPNNVKQSHLIKWENVSHDIKDDMDITRIGLELHNQLRAIHSSPPLQLDMKLVEKAESWARTLSLRSHLDMSGEPSLGQNVYRSSTNSSVDAVKDAIQFWYSAGLSQYNWTDVKSNWDNSVTLDFSQIVWKSSKKMGIGLSPINSSFSSPETSSGFFVVAFYSPQGNIVLEDDQHPETLFVQNVLPKRKGLK